MHVGFSIAFPSTSGAVTFDVYRFPAFLSWQHCARGSDELTFKPDACLMIVISDVLVADVHDGLQERRDF